MNLRTFLSFLLCQPFSLPVFSHQAGWRRKPRSAANFARLLRLQRGSPLEEKFMAVPDPKLAGEELKTLTLEPHLAATPEDRKTAEYVAGKFRAAGLRHEIVPYRVLLNWPKVVRVEAWDEAGHLLMSGPTREHVEGDPARTIRAW
jgi:hypothetical protein